MRKDLKEKLEDLRSRIGIDRFALGVECGNQASFYEEVGELEVEEKAETRRAKVRLDYVKAELETKIRTNPEGYDLIKVTEGAILAKIILQDEYQKALYSHIDQQEVSESLSILLASVEQRKAMLRDEVSLYINNYYSSQDLGKEMKDVSELDEEKIMKYKRDRAQRRKDNGKERSNKSD